MQKVVNNIKNIDIWSNGATNLLNSESANSLSAAIDGLTLKQAQLALSTKNLTQDQRNQVLVQAGLIASEDRIQSELLQSALAQAGVSTEKQKAILTELGLMDAKTNEIFVTKACTKEELLNMLATKGITGANAEAIMSILGLAGANGTATISFELLTASIWANIKALVTWLATNPVGWCVLAAATIFGTVKAFDALTVSFDEAVEKTKSSKEELDQLTSEVSDLNNELKTTKDRIEELLEKANSGAISLLEEEELNNLREQSDELQREINLKEKLAEIDAKEAAESAAYSLTYRTDDNHWDDEYHATDRIDKLQKYVDSANYYQEKISEIDQQILDIEESAVDGSYKNDSVYKSLIEKQKKYQDGLQKVEEQISSVYQELSVEDDGLYYNGKVIEGYEDLAERLDTVYLAVDLYFNDGNDTTEKYIETIKNKLIESGFSEEISNAVAEGFSNEELDSIMNSSSIDWSQCLGLDDATAVINNIKEQLSSVGDMNKNYITPLSISETVTQIDTRLKSAFSSLQSAYQEIFTLDEDTGKKLFTSLDEADITDQFKPILDALNDLDKMDGITVDYSAYEDFVSILSDTSSTAEDVQAQFDSLATSIIYASDCTKLSSETFNLLAESLSEMGISNAYEVLEDILELQNALSAEGIDVTTAMSGEAEALRNLTFASDDTAMHLMAYYIQKQLAENPISTLEDLLQLEKLCNALGVTGEMFETITALKLAFEAKESGAHASGLDESIKANQQRLAELAAGYGSFAFDFGGTKTDPAASSGSASAKSAAETYDWTTQAIERVEKEIEELDKIANSSYSTFSQKNEALAQEIQKVSDEIDLQQQAYDEYMRKAESITLPDQYKQLVQSGAINIENISDENLQNLISEYQKWYNKAQDVSDAIKNLKTDMKDLYVSAYDLQKGNLKDRLDRDSITQKQYLDGLKEAYEKFYADLEDFAEQYHEAVLEYLAEEKNYLNSVAGAAASLIDAEIDKIQEDAQLQEDSIQKQIDLLEAKKKPLQDELDALEEKEKRESLILNLQKAQYELARSENQRTKLVYENGQMVYTSDSEAIKDAQKKVDDARLEIQKQSIQDRIDALDHEINQYHDLIDQINNAADIQINALEKIKNKWQEVTDQQEYTKNVSLLMGEFGANAITKILTGNDDALLAQWKQNYISALAGIDMESQGYIGDMTQQIASLYDVDLSTLQSQFQSVTGSISGVTDALGRAASAVGLGTIAPTYDQDAEADPANNISSASLSASITNLGMISNETLPSVTSSMEEIEETAMNASLEVSNAADAIHNIPESKEVTISIHTVGANGVSGGMSSEISQTAYANGTAYASGTRHAKRGIGVIGEEKPELVVTNNQKAFLAERPTLLHFEGGETVFDGTETANMLRANGFRPVTPDEFPLLKAFSQYSADNIRQSFSPNIISPARTISSSAIQNAGNVNNNSIHTSSYTLENVHIHCPGVTKDEVARQIGAELNHVFSGLSLKAYQRVNITR